MKLYCVVIYVTSSYIWQTQPQQILLYPQDNLFPVLCHAPVSRAWWTSSTGHVTVTRAVPRQWWSTWPEGHSRGMAPVVASSKGQSRPPGRRPLLAYSNPSPSSHGSEIVKSDRRGIILTKPKKKNRSADGGLRGIIYSVECEFFVDICLCYHNSNDTYYVRIKMMEFVPYVPMLPSWIIIPLVVCNSMVVI